MHRILGATLIAVGTGVLVVSIASFRLSSEPSGREPASPGAFWIWPDYVEARGHLDRHPREALCLVAVPDGYATEQC